MPHRQLVATLAELSALRLFHQAWASALSLFVVTSLALLLVGGLWLLGRAVAHHVLAVALVVGVLVALVMGSRLLFQYVLMRIARG
ncbi:MAG: hypothetical protein JWM53_956 [bacterium]|nr:hypothetical protein [bacterium]